MQETACAACADLQALCVSLRCCGCAPTADHVAVSALAALKDRVSSALRQKLAVALAGGSAEAKGRLEAVVAALGGGLRPPIILDEPPPCLEAGGGTLTLNCEAFASSTEPMHYQWMKDGVPLRRAERPRLVLAGFGPRDEGSYSCSVSAGAELACTRPCEVRLRADERARQGRFESPMRRATEARQRGDVDAEIRHLREAAEAAGEHEAGRAEALCLLAEAYVRLEQWQDAFRESTAAVKHSPGQARSHASRGMAASKLGYLAEAVSSWETAELLGGVPRAAQEAEACRLRLREFFAANSAAPPPKAQRAPGSQSAGDGQDWEESWRRNGWQQGRHAGFRSSGAAGAFGAGAGGGTSSGGAPCSPDLRRSLEVLGLAAGAGGALPGQDDVRKAYRRLALQAHPDKPGGSKAKFQQLQDAYERLLAAVSG